MIVRVLHGHTDAFYECQEAHFSPDPSGNDPNVLMITMERKGTRERNGPQNPVTLWLDKECPESLEVYLMNDEGKTICQKFRKAKTPR